MLDLFTPYLPFISFFIAIMLNTLLVIVKSPWYGYIIANSIMSVILLALGINPFDIIGTVIEYLITLIFDIITGIINGIANAIGKLIWGDDYVYKGGGGTGVDLR